VATNMTVQLEDRPGQLASMSEALGEAGIYATVSGKLVFVVSDIRAALQA
jgi:hypothetical protein